jgi:signal transduction histidine kinase
MERAAVWQAFPCTLEKQRRHADNRQYSAWSFMLRQRISLAQSQNRGNGSKAPDPVRTQQLEQVTAELNRVTGLYNLAVAVGSSLKLDEVLWRLYKESSVLIDTTNFAFIIYDREAATLNFELVIDQGRSLKPCTVKLAQSHGLVRRVLTERMPVLVEDLINDRPAGIGQNEEAIPVRSWLGVPIFNPTLADEGVQGVIAIWSSEPKAFTDHDLWLLAAIGTQAAIAVRNARMYEASQRQAAENARLHQTVLAERDRVIAAQEQARKALASELHDGPTQLVSAVMMHLDFCRMLLEHEPSRLAEELTTTRDLVQRAVHQIRTLLFELRPLALETRGLVAALNVFMERRQEEILDQTTLTLEHNTGQPDGELLWRDKKVEAA